MSLDPILTALATKAEAEGLAPLELGPPVPAATIDAVEAELGALLPPAFRAFLETHGRVAGWDIASTIRPERLVAESRSLTETLREGARFRAVPFLAPLHAGDAVAVVLGTTDAATVGYSFCLAHRTRREESRVWFFWRDEYVFDEVGSDGAGWLGSFLGYALAWALETRD